MSLGDGTERSWTKAPGHLPPDTYPLWQKSRGQIPPGQIPWECNNWVMSFSTLKFCSLQCKKRVWNNLDLQWSWWRNYILIYLRKHDQTMGQLHHSIIESLRKSTYSNLWFRKIWKTSLHVIFYLSKADKWMYNPVWCFLYGYMKGLINS